MLGLELEHWCEGAKGFFLGAQHVGGSARNHGGLKEFPLQGVATGFHFATLRNGVSHMALDLGDGSVFDQRALGHAVFKAVADFHGLDLGTELGHELVVHAFLHIEAVGADTGLACVAVFAGEGPFHGGVDVGVVKHDEGSVATQLQRELLHGVGALLDQDAAHFGRAGKAHVAHHIAGANHFANGNGVIAIGADHVEHAGRNAGAHGQFGSSQSGQRGQLGGLDDHGATSGKRRCHLAGDHGQREVPGGDGSAHTDGLLDHHQAAVVVKLGQGFAVQALGFFGKPLHEARTIGYFALGFAKRLALLGGHDAPQVFLVGHEQVEPLAQDDAALFCGLGFPCRPSRVGGSDGFFGICGAQVGYVGQLAAIGRVQHVKTRCASNPLAVDEGVCLEQAGVIE